MDHLHGGSDHSGSGGFAEADIVLEIRSRICYRTIATWWI